MYIQQKHVQYNAIKDSFKASIALFPENKSSPNGIPLILWRSNVIACVKVDIYLLYMCNDYLVIYWNVPYWNIYSNAVFFRYIIYQGTVFI